MDTISTNKIIRHPGRVEKITPKEIKVRILSMSACGKCHAKGFCTAADMGNKIVDVKNNYDKDYKEGDNVTLVLKCSKGKSAVWLGYFLPFLVVLTSLVVFSSILESDGIAGLISLGFLAPYYFILYRFNERIKQQFDFKIEE